MDKKKSSSLKISEAADLAKVSTVTIRNWIKTGYLVKDGRGLVSRESLLSFFSETAGVDKLNSRANKLQKDNHDHEKLAVSIKERINTITGKQLSDEYELSLSNSYKNKEGIYYTPKHIVKDMLKGVKITETTTFLDPCCGSGNFIIEAIKKGVKPENVFGFDIDQNAIEIVKKRIFEETSYRSENIKLGDFLSESKRLGDKNVKFDLIFTNPPWGKKLKKLDKEKIAGRYNAGSSKDTSSLFLFASIKLLKPKGYLGFLVQEAFFNIASFEDARKKILENKIERLIDYGKPFKKLLSGAQSFILRNESVKTENKVKCTIGGKSFFRNQSSFILNPKSILNFWLPADDALTIEKIFSLPHINLKDNAKWALGIVTGNNSKFCVDKPSDGYIPIYKGTDITKDGLKQASCYIYNDFTKYQQVSPLEMFRSKDKIIYRFISSRLVFYNDINQEYILNSANLLILSEEFDLSSKQICDLFNSDFMNWLFKSLFKTHKILRKDIEFLPIYLNYFKNNVKFVEEDYLKHLGIMKTGKGTYKYKK